MSEKEIERNKDIDLIPLGKGAILVDRANPGTFYIDDDAEGSVEIRLEPAQKGYKNVTFTLSMKRGKVSVENCKGGKVHQDGCGFRVEHERENDRNKK